MDGEYAHGMKNPLEVFGNTFSAPTWGYPAVYCPIGYEEQEESSSGIHWGWLAGAIALTIVSVVAGAFTGGMVAKILAPAKAGLFTTAFAGGLIAGGIVGGMNLVQTGIRTDGFNNMTGGDWMNIGFTSAGSAFAGALGSMLTALTPMATGTRFLAHRVVHGMTSMFIAGGAYTILGALSGNFTFSGLFATMGFGFASGLFFNSAAIGIGVAFSEGLLGIISQILGG